MSEMTDVTHTLPKRLQNLGATLHQRQIDKRMKFVLACSKFKWRGFIYVSTEYRDADASLKDLYANFEYENGLTSPCLY